MNSVVAGREGDRIRLNLSSELREIVNPSILEEIQQAISSILNVSCRLEFVSDQVADVETPFEARQRQLEAQRQAAIAAIKASEIARKFNRAFGAELVESSVRKIDG